MRNNFTCNNISVSVIVPNFNHQPFLQERLNSIICQTFTTFECIILDDASEDNSIEIIDSYVDADERLSSINYLQNSGNTFVQWNKGINIATGQFIWLAESDDKADPELLNALLKPLLEDPNVVLSYCQSHKMNQQGIVTGSWSEYTADLDSSQFEKSFVMDGIQFIDKYLIKRNVIPNASAVLFRKSIFDKAGGADEMLKTNSDWLTWLKMLCYGKVSFIHHHLNHFRYHSKSVIGLANSSKNRNQYSQQFDYVLRKKYAAYVKAHGILMPENGMKFNRLAIQLDEGNKGLFLLDKGLFFYGWYLILKSSIYPKIQSGFIKKAFKYL
jgi:glycosyltransferase involved in cell wall biosynthesis